MFIVPASGDTPKELVEAEHQAHEQLDLAVDALHELTEVVVETKGVVEGIGVAVSKFNVAVESIESSQMRYAEMVTQFGLFVQEQQSKQAKEVTGLHRSISYDSFMEGLKAELDENDLLIEQMKGFMTTVSV